MADIELVIKIDDNLYKAYQRRVNNPKMMVNEVDIAIANGTPLPKGRWEHGKEISREFRGPKLVDINYLDWHCSNCHCVVEQPIKPKWNYCPNCGAKMSEQEE